MLNAPSCKDQSPVGAASSTDAGTTSATLERASAALEVASAALERAEELEQVVLSLGAELELAVLV